MAVLPLHVLFADLHVKVKRLAQHRAVDPDNRRGIEALQEEFRKLGYAFDWTVVNSVRFFLPQDRERVYAFALKLSDMSDQCATDRRADLAEVMRVFCNLQLTCEPEPLETVLGRSAGAAPTINKPTRLKSKPDNARATSKPSVVMPEARHKMQDAPLETDVRWKKQHDAFIKQANLDESALEGRESFGEGLGLADRARDVLFLKLAQRKRQGHDWRKEVLVLKPGQSISWCPLSTDKFPCLTPHGPYIFISKGAMRVVSGLDALALQGIQKVEVDKWGLAAEENGLLHDLAGNAMTANVLAAALLAGLGKVTLRKEELLWL